MKNLTKTIIALTAAAILGVASGIEASAKDSDYTREELIDLLWTDYWSDSLPGEENPEGSLEYYILECFLDENYGVVDYHVVSDWSSYYLITSAWEDYHDAFTQYWDYEDDDETNEFTIRSYDPETDEYGDTLYTFELIDGMWNMIDTNGNTYLTFEPHGGDGSYAALKEKEDNSSIDFSGMTEGWATIDGITKHYVDGEVVEEYPAETGTGTGTTTIANNNEEAVATTNSSEEKRASDGEASNSASNSASSSNSNRVTGTTANSQAESEEISSEDSSETDEEDENASLPIPLIIAGIIIVGGGVGAIIYSKKKKNGGKKK